VRTTLRAVHDVCNRLLLAIGMHHYRSSELEEVKGHSEEIGGEQSEVIKSDRN
jgi:hypothetical protein